MAAYQFFIAFITAGFANYLASPASLKKPYARCAYLQEALLNQEAGYNLAGQGG
jgi:hypothetical protein